MVAEYSFTDKLRNSDGVSESRSVRDILLGNIPGALDAHRSHEKNDRNGTDWWVEHESGRHLSVDTKVRDEDWSQKNPPADDLALETWSVVESQKIGWTRDSSKRCDFILWLWKDTGRWCMVPFPMLCKVFDLNWQRWAEEFKTRQQKTVGWGQPYHSECVFVPRRTVWAEIYRHFAG